MTEEQKECKCPIQSECFKKFLIVMIGSFLGVFFGMSLFTYTHKPPMPPCNCAKHFGGPSYGHGCPKFEKQFTPKHFDKEHMKHEKPAKPEKPVEE